MIARFPKNDKLQKDMENRFIKISGAEIGQRLDKILSNRLRFPRPYIKNQIKKGIILVNKKSAKPGYALKKNDIISFEKFALHAENIEKSEILPNPDIKFKIIYEDRKIIVIDKPAGISVHPRSDKNGLPLKVETQNTLVSGLLAHYPLLKEVGEEPKIRPGIVHRLDKDTSGVMIIAKDNDSFQYLKEQFQNKTAQKKYLALVVGRLKQKKGTICAFITRSIKDPTKQRIVTDYQLTTKLYKKVREAITEYEIIEEFKNFSLIEARPLTGRMHQIRLHFASIGHPIAGDKKYSPKRTPIPKGLSRQFLHAAYLKIKLPGGKLKEFKSDLSDDLKTTLEILPKV